MTKPKKRQYIGGNKEEARVKYFNTDKKLSQAIVDLSKAYHVSPKLVFSRLGREGIIDGLIRFNNDHVGENFQSLIDNTDTKTNHPYNMFGMDTVGGRYREGKIKTNRKIPFEYYNTENEGGESVTSIQTFNTYDTLEMFVADIASRRNELKEKYPKASDSDLNMMTAAYLNNGIKRANKLINSGEYKTKYKIDKDIDGLKIPPARTYTAKKPNVNYSDYNKLPTMDFNLSHIDFMGKSYDPNDPSNQNIRDAYIKQLKTKIFNENHSIPYGTTGLEYYNPYYDSANTFEEGGEANNNKSGGSDLGGKISAVAGAASGILEAALSNAKIADTSELRAKIDSANNNLYNAQSTDDLLSQINNYSSIGNVTWRDVRRLSKGQAAGNIIGAIGSGAAAGASVGGPLGAVAGAAVGLGSSLAGLFTGNKKAKRTARRLNRDIDSANARNINAMDITADNLDKETNLQLLSNYAAYGGELDTPALGLFNKYSTVRTGRFYSIPNYSNRYDNGGYMNNNILSFGGDLQSKGGDFPTGVLTIGNGGFHEANPNGGVLFGVGDNGKPNLVEEGESIFNGYVFSNRLKVPRGKRGNYGKRDKTFAEAARDLSKESEERPNDPISKLGLNSGLSELMLLQELVRETGALEDTTNTYKEGGIMIKPENKGKFTALKERTGKSASWFKEHGTPKQKKMATFALNAAKWNHAFGGELDLPNTFDWGGSTEQGVVPGEELYGNQYMSDISGHSFNENEYNRYLDLYNKNLNKSLSKDETEEYSNLVNKGYFYQKDSNNKPVSYLDFLKSSNSDYTPIAHIRPTGTKVYKTESEIKNEDMLAGESSLRQVSVTPKEPAVIPFDIPYSPLGLGFEAPAVKSVTINPLNIKDAKKLEIPYVPAKENKNNPYLGKSPEWLRYAPVVGLGISSLTDAIGLTNDPDYTAAKNIEAEYNKGTYQPVSWNPIGNYLQYTPIDRNYYSNILRGQAAGTRGQIMNSTSPDRYAALLAADYNAQNKLGELFFRAEKENFNRRKEVEDFNRSTNITNAEGLLKADMANQSAAANLRDYRLRGAIAANELRSKAREEAEKRKNANLSSFFQALGDIGYENAQKNLVRAAIAGSGTVLSDNMLKSIMTKKEWKKYMKGK